MEGEVANIVISQTGRRGEFTTDGLAAGKVALVSTEMMSEVFQRSLAGAFYPFRFHDTEIEYNHAKRWYLIRIAED